MLGVRQKTENTNTGISVTLIPISKTIKVTGSDNVLPGIDVASHCRITGLIAHELLNCFPERIRKRLFPPSAEFLAACHDIGKISPDFQKMIYEHTAGFNPAEHPELESANSGLAKRNQTAFHAKVTQAVFENVLSGNSEKAAQYIPVIEGMHHGFRPNISPCREDSEIYGSKEWMKMRHSLLEHLKEMFPVRTGEPAGIGTWYSACIMGGLIIVADWLASGGEFAAFTQSAFDTLSDTILAKMAELAVHNAGFTQVMVRGNLSFADIFGFEPRQIQTDFYENITGPGVYILEAPMGIGKTEAALYAAYKMLENGWATGVYFGLPTQLTSNKIYERVLSFLARITGEKSGDVSLKLLHSAAWLEDKILGEDADLGKSWFDSGKRGILAPFAVGTVDQALMAVLNVRHSMVRSFGLAGKVVILDEVHSYDAYTGTILNELIAYLRQAQCTVIILSATLTAVQKRNIMKFPSDYILSESYPLITAVPDQIKQIREIPSAGGKPRSVYVSIEHNMLQVLEQVLEKAEQGEQILWIENTVSEAQQVFRTIAARVSGTEIECGLIHSRYIKTQRNIRESKWTKLFGKDGFAERTAHGRILVGTQVLEQSLDIDADFMVTKLCPADMLLQRFGRLWRHTENDTVRPDGSLCSAVLLAPEYSETLEKEGCFGLSSFVYSEYVLCRTLEIWKDIKTVQLPGDIRPLLEATYKEREETGRLAKLQHELQFTKDKLEGMARIGLSTSTTTMPESVVQTRYSETESISILLLKSFILTDTGCKIEFCGADGSSSIPKVCRTEKEKRRIAKELMEHCVTVSEKNAPPVEQQIQVFAPYVYLGKSSDRDNEEESPFRVALVGNDDYLRTLQHAVIERDGKRFLYTDTLGYQIEDRRGK
jgi:CRISPR-associated endonuclease/helicase Cas3